MTPEHLPLPEAFVKRMEKMLGVEAPAFFASYERPARRSLRFDPAKVAAGEQARLLEAMGIEAEPVPWAADAWYYPEDATPGKHPFHTLGLYYIQEASAMLPATLLEVEPGERVLDLCAAPGGKTTQLAAALRGRGLLLANEVHPARAKVLSQNVERWGSAGVVVTREEPARLAARFPAFFDKVLVDAPCSGEGMFRKDEQARGEWSEEAVRRCAARQQNILESAAAMVAPGGLLCYSTCTFSEEENEETVAAFLSRHRDFRQIDLRKRLGPASAGIVVGRDGKSLRIFPHLAEGEGHFAALMQRDGTPLMRDRMDRIEKKKKGKDPALERALDLWNDFRKEMLIGEPQEETICLLFGKELYALPAALSLEGLFVERPGLHLGTVEKDRFQPAYALARHLRPAEVRQVRTLQRAPVDELAAVFGGQAIVADAAGQKGWVLLEAEKVGAAWAKLAGTRLQNHMPKGLRTPL